MQTTSSTTRPGIHPGRRGATRANRKEEIAIHRDDAGPRHAPLWSSGPGGLQANTVYWRGQAAQVAHGSQDHPHTCPYGTNRRGPTASLVERISSSIGIANVYVCPAGKLLTNNGLIDQGRILPYRASMYDCRRCELKPRCTTANARKVSRDIDEDVRDHVSRSRPITEAFQQSRRERKKVEMRFAHMKPHFSGSTGFDCED